ncbi:MAG: hypothetical protein DRI57_12705 [Deltaproteobacteria bacterium]|nr:MAG: hypothetical protein DRI57_12705 [Deltaproteobacteria bacterium]
MEEPLMEIVPPWATAICSPVFTRNMGWVTRMIEALIALSPGSGFVSPLAHQPVICLFFNGDCNFLRFA